MDEPREIRFVATERAGEVGALLLRPDDADILLVLAHGAGAGMRHTFLESRARRLADRRVATFRYQFPYAEKSGRRPDPAPVLEATVRAAVGAAAAEAAELPLFAGGKSMGGRMTSRAQSDAALPGVCGIAFVGFPLHPAGRRGTERAEHLGGVTVPTLFLQGTRDDLADLLLLRPILDEMPAATLHVVDGADHSFRVPRATGRTQADVLDELASRTREWMDGVLSSGCSGSR
jgi:predicted alpha/beta-hydrolase family hydrolase